MAKQGILAVLLGMPLLLGMLWLMEGMGANWWFYAWLAWMAFNIILLAIFPTWIAPIFNKFTPLADPSLKTRIEQLMRKCGFKSSGLFVMDGSRRSNHGNAYFTGFGKTNGSFFLIRCFRVWTFRKSKQCLRMSWGTSSAITLSSASR